MTAEDYTETLDLPEPLTSEDFAKLSTQEFQFFDELKESVDEISDGNDELTLAASIAIQAIDSAIIAMGFHRKNG